MLFLKSSFLLFSSWGNNGSTMNQNVKDLQQILLSPFSNNISRKVNDESIQAQETIQSFISTFNKQGKPNTELDVNTNNMVAQFFDDDISYTDTAFYNPIEGKNNLLRHFLLFQESDSSSLSIHSNRNIVIDDITSGLEKSVMDNIGGENKDEIYSVCVKYHLEELVSDASSDNTDAATSTNIVPDSKGITYYSLRDNKITSVFDAKEVPSPKPGNAGLELLSKAYTILGFFEDEESGESSNVQEVPTIQPSTLPTDANIIEKYFDGWNRRDMEGTIEYFTDDCEYEDLQFESPFSGKAEVKDHLLNVARCVPGSFEFKFDKLVVMPNMSNSGNPFSSTIDFKESIGIQWHVESEGKELPFAKGCSFYTTGKNGLIQSGVDIPEPAVIKTGAVSSISKKFIKEPIRLIPATMWLAYMYIVFFSDGILPGANALALEQRTWEEVRDLSLNFFLVSPILNLPFAPVVHPMLEGVFNLLLAWAGMFAGFLSDERKNKANLLPFGPIVIGMQFLTSAFLLPYLALRSSEKEEIIKETVYKEDIDGSVQATIGEWKPLGSVLGGVGSASILWAIFSRPEFGDLNERYTSFLELLSIDRVGSSFLVDLAIFALFQGWFVDDDMKRRGVASDEMVALKNIAKFVPFFGLAYYLSFRPDLPSSGERIQE